MICRRIWLVGFVLTPSFSLQGGMLLMPHKSLKRIKNVPITNSSLAAEASHANSKMRLRNFPYDLVRFSFTNSGPAMCVSFQESV